MGHSYGGLFTLYALFTHADMFDTYVAISPSIWWNSKYIETEEEQFRRQGPKGGKPKKLAIFYGSYEQYPLRITRYSDEEWNKTKGYAAEKRLKDNAGELYERLLASGKLSKLKIKEYPEEDHVSVTGCGISGGVTFAVGE